MNEIPKINFNGDLPPLTSKAISSINTMAKNMRNKGINSNFLYPIPPIKSQKDVENLESSIASMIGINRANNFEEKGLIEIFHAIQLWGGKSGRNIYLMGGGIQNNLNISSYRLLAKVCSGPFELGKIETAVLSAINQSRNIGIAFMTKHSRFWLTGTNYPLGPLPIYDSIMSKNLMNVEKPEFRDLRNYWDGMIDAANRRGITLPILERHLFNHFRG